jgi:hypothetical protein
MKKTILLTILLLVMAVVTAFADGVSVNGVIVGSGMPTASVSGQMAYWNGSAWVVGSNLLYNGTDLTINLGAGTADAPFKIGSNATQSSDCQIEIARNVDNTGAGSGANGHAFSDSSVVSRGGSIGYNSYDARIIINGTNNFNHYASFQSGETYSSSGTITNLFDFYASPTITAGTVTNRYGVSIQDATVSGGMLTNDYGIYIQPITSGSSLNYALYNSGSGLVYSDGRIISTALVINPSNAVANTSGSGAFEIQTNSGTAAGMRIYQLGVNSWDILSPASSTSLTIGDTGGAIITLGHTGKTTTLAGTLTTAAGVTYDFGALTTGSSGQAVDATKYVTVTIAGAPVKLAVLQ